MVRASAPAPQGALQRDALQVQHRLAGVPHRLGYDADSRAPRTVMESSRMSVVDDDAVPWKAFREERQARRAARRPLRQAEIEALRASGFTVERKSDYHFRINGALDL